MSTPFQNRLVGTIIVAAAAIIFLPDIFDGEKKAYQAQFEAIPDSPKAIQQEPIKAFEQRKFDQLNQQKSIVSDDKAQDEQLLGNEANEANILEKSGKQVASHTISSTPKNKPLTKNIKEPTKEMSQKVAVTKSTKTVIKPVPKSVDKSIAYVIQLGSFRHKKNVEQLVNKLKKNGYTVFTKPIKTSAGNLTKVFIGPQLSESELQKMLPKLKSLTGVQGRVSTYQPIDK